MSNKIKGFTVVLEEDFDVEFAEEIKNSINMIRGVANVESLETTGDDYFNRERIKAEFRTKFFRKLHELMKDF